MNSKTNTVRAILLDASECDRPEADHPGTIEICADDLQRILERHITEPAQCLLQIAEPATAGTAVRVFRDYLGVHDGIKLGGHAMDDMALDLARIALNFPEALKGVRSEKPEPAPPQAVQPVVPLPLLVRDIARDLGITVPEACIALKPLGYYSTNSVVTAEMATKLREAFPNPAPQAVQAAVRDGWKTVPINPTLEMMVAAKAHMNMRESFRAMMAAAPAHPAEGVHCSVCGADEAFTGTCGGGRSNPRALCFERAAIAATQPAAQQFQARVGEWLMECFGHDIAHDGMERNHRFLEEALELVQSLGCTASEAHQLVDYVFGRPVGEPVQELGGVMVTLAALCFAHELDMAAGADKELARICDPATMAKIKAKQASKPRHSPLPQLAATQPAADAVASIYVTAGGEREFDDWKMPLSVGRNLLYTQPAAQGLDAWISVKDQLPEIHEWQEGSIAGISDLVLTCNEFDPDSLITQYLRKGGCGDLTTLHWEDSPTHWMKAPAIAAQAKQGGAA